VKGARPLALLLFAGLLVLAGCVGTAGPGGAPTATDTPQPAPANGTLSVHAINVGQSESTLVVGPNETMLIDTGNFVDDGAPVRQYLREHGIDRIDHLVVTHADADHIGGTAAIIEMLETEGEGVGAIYDPGIAASTQTYERYLDAVEKYDVTLYETRAGDRLDFADADVDVLAPPEPYIDTDDRNENSIVLRLTHGQAGFLFTGDAGPREEAYLVDRYGDRLRATVLKTGHHGSASSTGAALLDAVGPTTATISSAYDSRYGHPDEAVLNRLAAANVTTYWTATHGTIRLTSTGRRITVATQQPAPTAPLALREGTRIDPGSDAALEQRAIIWTANGTVADATPSAPPTTTAPPSASLALVEINADAAGDDWENLDDEYLVFENQGQTALNLTGWTVSDASGATYTFPAGVTLQPGSTVTLYTGDGTDSATTRYWGAGRPVWNNGGDTVTVSASNGTAVLTEEYE
jgi:competence protein ComEC